MDKIIYILLLQCVEIMCMNVERRWVDLCGENVQCPKLKPSCALIKAYGAPYCRKFNDSIFINLHKNQHGFFKILSIKSINILNGFKGWREMEYKTKLKLKWSNEMSGRLIKVSNQY